MAALSDEDWEAGGSKQSSMLASSYIVTNIPRGGFAGIPAFAFAHECNFCPRTKNEDDHSLLVLFILLFFVPAPQETFHNRFVRTSDMTNHPSTSMGCWSIDILEDPLRVSSIPSSVIVSARATIGAVMIHNHPSNVLDEGRVGRVVLADVVARTVAEMAPRLSTTTTVDGVMYSMATLDQALTKKRRRQRQQTITNTTNTNASIKYPPYVLERSDIWCSQDHLHVTLRMTADSSKTPGESLPVQQQQQQPMALDDQNDNQKSEETPWEWAAQTLLCQLMEHVNETRVMEQVACVVLQHKLRTEVAERKGVAFIADDSILPRKSGTSDAPMASPPAIPFKAPVGSSMTQELSIDMGGLAQYLRDRRPSDGSTVIHLRGLLVPAGITLICGGGYHGKSTMLQTIAAGVYDKIPGDGREYCVALPDAVSVRAEDGRYVHHCNISAFISNLPTPPGATHTVDTTKFSTRDSSGSTSQAANVSEAMEMGCRAMLIDEDISAANFMARDGRMRSLVMDESITPLLYRVNGLFHTHGISSVVVVGGVGDWLDVPHNVILLDKYVATDATAKAQSISRQFSHGHVQYGGKGVVHRLEWDKSGTPVPRRPVDAFSKRFARDVFISLLDGGNALTFHHHDDDNDDNSDDDKEEEDDGYRIEASKLEQLLGRQQLFGCGLCVLWILQVGIKDPTLGLPHLLNRLDEVLDQGGLMKVVEQLNNFHCHVSSSSSSLAVIGSETWKNVMEEVGVAQRPRKHEVGQALTRMYGIQMEAIPTTEDDTAEEEAKRLAEQKRQELLKIWENRRIPRHSRFE